MIRKDETVLSMKEEVSMAVLFACALHTDDESAQIEFLWEIPTYYQRVYHNGRELDDNKITISEAGLVFDTVVHVKDCAEDMFGDMSDVEHVPSTRKERAAGGFRNTLLHGLPVEDASGSEKSPEATPDVEEMDTDEEEAPQAQGWPSTNCTPHVSVAEFEILCIACPTCTFLNKPGFLVCEICEAQL